MLYLHDGFPRAFLRVVDDFGFKSFDLVGFPRRLCEFDLKPELVESNVDARRVKEIENFKQLIETNKTLQLDSWTTISTRTLSNIFASFLIAEDPQRRLDTRKAATLMHQVSLVQHILNKQDLKKVLIGDEVGLGKTIEAGLIIKQLLDRNPRTRVLYLAPARLISNVASEFRDKLEIDARCWIAGSAGDARISDDRVVIASINKAVFGNNFSTVLESGPWDVVVVDECHHLSDWNPSGGNPNQAFRLVSQLIKKQPLDGRLILMSGTPHQGNEARFQNILRLLSDDPKSIKGAAGRVIFRTKDRVKDWKGSPLFPSREIRPAIVVDLGDAYKRWYSGVGLLYEIGGLNGIQLRAAGWAKGQALQWAASSLQAGVGFLVRLGIRRLNWGLEKKSLRDAMLELRPYRGGANNESLESLYKRLQKQIGSSALLPIEDEEINEIDEEEVWRPDPNLLLKLLDEGVKLIQENAGQAKWEAVFKLIEESADEKIVLFAQPVETVTAIAEILEKRYGEKPALIIGNQNDIDRMQQVSNFQSDLGSRFLVSSKAGGEGLNMQKARRLIHLDVPWNPMDLEQRIGRIHRFGSRKTIIVDTVVASGSREIDMYKIARDKLAMVAKHLDPEQFETLFSRVMSLVPPKELENILGGTYEAQSFERYASSEIGRLVTEGYKSWSAFDEKYRIQAEEIRSANPGEAEWPDLIHYLSKFSDGVEDIPATYSGFEFQDDEIIAVDQQVSTVKIGNNTFACGDTGGLKSTAPDGSLLDSIGLNISEVQLLLRKSFDLSKPSGVAFLRAPINFKPSYFEVQNSVIFFMLRQKLQQEGGLWVEKSIELHSSVVYSNEQIIDLSSKQKASLVRLICSFPKIRMPNENLPKDTAIGIGTKLIEKLRRPSDEEIEEGIRCAVWPIGLVFLTRN